MRKFDIFPRVRRCQSSLVISRLWRLCTGERRRAEQSAQLRNYWRNTDLARTAFARIARGSQSWPVLGAGFKPVVRYFVSRVGSTPTGFRQTNMEAR